MIIVPTPKTNALKKKHQYSGDPAFGEALDLCFALEMELESVKRDLEFRRELYKHLDHLYDNLYEEAKTLKEINRKLIDKLNN
jgi:hypothetical protein